MGFRRFLFVVFACCSWKSYAQNASKNKVLLSKDSSTYLNFGGDVRFQFFQVVNDEWGEQPDHNYGYVFSRFLGHADLHSGSYFRAFLELQSSMANAKPGTSAADENALDLHQAYVELNFPIQKDKLTFRFGRQELSYGSQRLISVREGPNNRQAFDGAKAIFSASNYKADFFYTHYVAAQKGVFDDGFNKNTKLWGAYLVFNKIAVLQNIDLYYLGLRKKNAVYDEGKGNELRHSIGGRIWAKKEDWRYDAEGLYQFGDFEDKSIRAWTASVNIAYRFNGLNLKPEFGLKTELISGDARYGDEKLGTFNPLFPRGGYFGLAALIGPVNLFDVHPTVNLELADKLSLDLDYDLFWRYSRQDGVYGPNVGMIYSGKNITSKYIGQQYSAVFSYALNKSLNFASENTFFKAGDFLKQSGPGKDIFFACITVQYKF